MAESLANSLVNYELASDNKSNFKPDLNPEENAWYRSIQDDEENSPDILIGLKEVRTCIT